LCGYLLKQRQTTYQVSKVPIQEVEKKSTSRSIQWLKWGGIGGGAQPPAPIWAPPPAIVWAPWLNLQSVILCLNNAKLVGLEWVWGLLQPGFVRWAPPASQNHFNHWQHSQQASNEDDPHPSKQAEFNSLITTSISFESHLESSNKNCKPNCKTNTATFFYYYKAQQIGLLKYLKTRVASR